MTYGSWPAAEKRPTGSDVAATRLDLHLVGDRAVPVTDSGGLATVGCAVALHHARLGARGGGCRGRRQHGPGGHRRAQLDLRALINEQDGFCAREWVPEVFAGVQGRRIPYPHRFVIYRTGAARRSFCRNHRGAFLAAWSPGKSAFADGSGVTAGAGVRQTAADRLTRRGIFSPKTEGRPIQFASFTDRRSPAAARGNSRGGVRSRRPGCVPRRWPPGACAGSPASRRRRGRCRRRT
jgi:hypothetical protein